MSSLADTQLFGVHLGALAQRLSRAVRGHAARVASLVAPDLSVRLIRADGTAVRAAVRGRRVMALTSVAAARAQEPSFLAIELPAALYLSRELRLPPLTDAELESALALEVASASPFVADDVLWGYADRPDAADGRWVDLVMCSRSAVLKWLDANLHSAPAELWAIDGLGAPVVLPWGPELPRLQRARRVGAERLALAGLALLLLLGVAVTPVLQLRQKAIAAGQSHERLAGEAKSALDARAALMDEVALADQVQKLGAGQADPLKVLNVLSQFIPDTAWLQAVKLEGMTASLTGMATNATELFQQLERIPGVVAVKPTSAVTRGQGGQQDRFTVDITLNPAAFARLPPLGGPS